MKLVCPVGSGEKLSVPPFTSFLNCASLRVRISLSFLLLLLFLLLGPTCKSRGHGVATFLLSLLEAPPPFALAFGKLVPFVGLLVILQQTPKNLFLSLPFFLSFFSFFCLWLFVGWGGVVGELPLAAKFNFKISEREREREQQTCWCIISLS